MANDISLNALKAVESVNYNKNSTVKPAAAEQVAETIPTSGADSPPQNAYAQQTAAVSSETRQSSQPITQQDIKEAANKIKQDAKSYEYDLQFSIEEDTGQTIIKVWDPSTNKVVKQYPQEEVVALARRLHDIQSGSQPKGILFNDET